MADVMAAISYSAWKVFTPKDALLKINSDALSTHGFGIAELIKFIEEYNNYAP